MNKTLENVRDALSVFVNPPKTSYGARIINEHAYIDAAKALSELEAYMETGGWLPIETVPDEYKKDGTPV